MSSTLDSPHADEIETRAELDRHLAAGTSARPDRAGAATRRRPARPDRRRRHRTRSSSAAGSPPARSPPTWSGGARTWSRRSPALPYPTQPPTLYTAGRPGRRLRRGRLRRHVRHPRSTQHFRAHGGALPDVREALAQRLHDHGIDNALADATRAWLARRTARSRSSGVMGGHAEPRGVAGVPAWRRRWAGSWPGPAGWWSPAAARA